MIKKQLGQKICALRKEKGMTQEVLAEASSYSVEFISFVERGINAPSVEGCERLATALGVTLSELFDF
ncbi:helix-turn-helix domain-containing protein [Tichowtungia aerotolerans]|uniref:Helix-turn-helix domain-containing protein n=1 Tax=Tichowtungia aerotolerans TaxID=2697043 RepID=A0A6P1M9M3_9BACT|nr:helix-turn-helix transcriptional regulator [Tichowtungia aerotolerans]QHI68778.1 helix-turn-helix domain-containing protein [Tichowtungia aerotolerans]